jgi:hypothetical protein
MTTLRRATNGDWFARKRIPEDIRSAYLKAHGKGQEERFRLSAALSPGIATQEFRDWDAEVSSRIERLRAKERGEGEGSLTPRQAQALAGQWYSWFIAQHEEDPGTVDDGESLPTTTTRCALGSAQGTNARICCKRTSPGLSPSGMQSIACWHDLETLTASFAHRTGRSATPQCMLSWTCLRASSPPSSASCPGEPRGIGAGPSLRQVPATRRFRLRSPPRSEAVGSHGLERIRALD